MARFTRTFARMLLLACASVSSLPTRQPSPPLAYSAILVMPEVRLRKLHLVRPDLIPYPVAYDIVC